MRPERHSLPSDSMGYCHDLEMQMRCLSSRGVRACWLLCFGKWLLRAVACWNTARLGRPRFASRRKRCRTEAEANFQTEN
jgi:hypothetical protein